MATATYPANRSRGHGLVRFEPNGRVSVASGSQDLGTGTYTIMAQVAAATLELPMDGIDAELGDSSMPKAPVSGGSQSAASVMPAVQAAAQQASLKLLTLAASDAQSPFHGAQPDESDFTDGRFPRKASPATGIYALVARNGNRPVERNCLRPARAGHRAVLRHTPSARSLPKSRSMKPRHASSAASHRRLRYRHADQRKNRKKPVHRRNRLGHKSGAIRRARISTREWPRR